MEEERPSSDLSLKAEELVTLVLERAHQAVIKDMDNNSQNKPTPTTDYARTNMDWVSCQDFTMEIGREQITAYIGTWGVTPRWLLDLVLLETTEEEHHSLHCYRAQWSIPTHKSPIPTETASVYFFVQRSKIKPQSAPVEVRYTVESTRTVHTPGQTVFREQWLEDVVTSKALLQRTVEF